ncbi:hypothetical protein ACF0H5_019705 [Mactra antiquata]
MDATAISKEALRRLEDTVNTVYIRDESKLDTCKAYIRGESEPNCSVVKSSSDGFEYLLRSRSGDELSLTQITEPYEVPDEWPSGSYTLLMSKYGCPRGRWKRGYISFNWKSPQILLSHGHKFHCNNYNITSFEYSTQCRKLISDKTMQTSSSNLFGPFSKYKMTLNFCQRQMDADGEDNRNSWPKIPFRIFDSDGTCPKGFKTEENTLTLPNITTWTYNGYLPTFSLTSDQNGHNILTMKECISEEIPEVNSTYYLKTNGSAFILLKHGDEPCPIVDSYYVWTELISIFEELSTSSTVTRLLQFCYFQPTSWFGYTLRTYNVKYGGTENFRRMSGCIDDGRTHTMFCSKQAICWLLIDIGRSLLIKYVSIINVIPEGVVFNSTVQAGNDKWTLLSYGGIEIATNSDTDGLETIGRFIIVLIQSTSVMVQYFEVQVHAEYTNTICMSDLGMSDGTIETTQISTSDIIQKNQDSVRPYSRGWCSAADDSYPFIQVDLLEDTRLDGITIYNWYETSVSENNGSYTKSFRPTGTRTFRVLGDDYTNMTFHVELFRPLDEPQTFVFHKQVKTRYVRIYIKESVTYGQHCIKFELHGCRKNDMLSLPSLMYHLDEYIVAYTGAVKTITTPSHITNVGYPLPYRDGTSYTWIIDFRSIGYIRIVFVEILLQEYEDNTFTNFWYNCKDSFTIKTIEDEYYTVPTSVKHENIVIETQHQYLIMEFTSCIPYTPRKDEGTRFSLYVDKMGRYLEVSDQFSPPVEYTNCDPPMSELLSEAECITISYKMRHQTLLETSSLMEEGFRATYSKVEASHQGLLDTIVYYNTGLQYIVDTRKSPACSSTFMKCYTIFTGTPLSWQLAREECRARGKTLVSIRSKEELHAVKYMMRTFLDVKIDDGSLPRVFEYDIPDPYYYLHIGISRITTSDSNRQFVWIDGSPLLFSAWGKGQPKADGNCVRMSFHQVTKVHTWEVEDCYETVSQYFICEEAVEELPLPIQVLLETEVVAERRHVPTSTQFVCVNQEIISILAVCDGIADCTDGSDEINCDKGCTKDEFECNDGRCIHASLVCDFVPHCRDHSDEQCVYKQCEFDEFRCDNGQCIASDSICNTYEDCLDGSDETNCNYCNNDAFHCDLTKCIPKRLVCDKIPDCRDGSDEQFCIEKQFLTCEHRWLNGLKKSGKYTLKGGARVECNYDSVQTEQTIYTSFHAVEHRISDTNYKIRLDETDENELQKFLADENYDCRQTFRQTCTLPVRTALHIEDPDTENQRCQCIALTVKPYIQDSAFVHECNDTSIGIDDSLINITYNVGTNGPYLNKTWSFTDNIEVKIGPIICKNADLLNVTSTSLTCDESGLTYTNDVRCIYKTDSTGYILGCRSGFHLQECAEFVCPPATVKCPGSYCIPLHYVCDGINQCPNGEDETGCGCNNNDLELIILQSEDDFISQDDLIKQFIGQFNNKGTVVRLLQYYITTSSTGKSSIDLGNNYSLPGYKILNIFDTAIDLSDVTNNRLDFYSIRDDEFMGNITFSNAKSRVLVFLQDGTNSATVADILLRKMTKPDFDIYRVMVKASKTVGEGLQDGYRFVTDITINNFDVLSTMGSRLFPSFCNDTSSTLCKNNFKCSSSKLCIAYESVCDGHKNCPFGDDEVFCDFQCPAGCTCVGYNAYCDPSVYFNSYQNYGTSNEKLRILDLGKNRQGCELSTIFINRALKFPYMIRLNMSNCNIEQILSYNFEHVPNLMVLDLSYNKLSRIPTNAFYELSKLVYLNLNGNTGLMTYEQYAFLGLFSLKHVVIEGSDIRLISRNAFWGLYLDALVLSHNKIGGISDDAFNGLSVDNIIFEGNTITQFGTGLFRGISNLKSLRTSAYKYCCVAPDYLNEFSCYPAKDEFSSCDDLMRNSALQTILWLMGVIALLGNMLAIIYRIVYDRERLKLGFGIFVTNLAVADLFMGVYLLIIAVADASFRKRYIFMDEYWRNSGWCILAGVLSTVSPEASVFFLCLITLDRFIVIKFPFSRLRFTPEKAGIAATIAWVLSLTISVVPLIDNDHFQSSFYSKSGVCIALPLTRDRPPGWLYSVVVFIVINFVTFIGIAIGQLSIYIEINNVSSKLKTKRTGKNKAIRRKELIIARNLLLVVATDFLCWFPICCMGMMAMSGKVIPGEVYAWSAVFILPVNSALNPVLYTLTAILNKRQQEKALMKAYSARSHSKSLKKNGGIDKMLIYFLPMKENYHTTLVSIEDLINEQMEVSPDVLLKFTAQMTHCLRLLHTHSMVLDTFDTSNVFVTMDYGKLSGKLHIKQLPKHEVSLGKKREDLYKMGIIIRRLVPISSKQV